MTSGTIFDSAWFAPERPAFDRIASYSDQTLTFLLIIGALVIAWIALSPRSPTLLKAVVLAYIILP